MADKIKPRIENGRKIYERETINTDGSITISNPTDRLIEVLISKGVIEESDL